MLVSQSFSVFAQAEEQESSILQEPTEEEVVELDRIAITGSRIKRTDIEGALPVTVFDREMIEMSGEQSVGDFVRSLSFNSFGSYRSQMNNAGIGTAQVDLRGLGSGRTLVLVDGRRLPRSPQSSEFQDLNTIPLGSVERIEILSDGASAIYGSDAIGGVVNIITRDDYSGWEVTYGMGEPNTGGGERSHGTLMFGRFAPRWNVTANLSFNDRDIAYRRDFDWTERADNFYSNNFFTVPSFALIAIPGACEATDAFYLVPNENSPTGDRCAYDFNRVASDETSQSTEGLLIRSEYRFDNGWSAWADLRASRTEAFGRLAPTPFITFPAYPPIPADSPNNPTNPDSVFYDPAFGDNVPVHIAHRFEAFGFRDWFIDTELYDLLLGANSRVGPVDLDVGFRSTWNDTDEVDKNFERRDLAYEAIVTGAYDLGDPTRISDELLETLRYDAFFDWSYDQREVFLTGNWDWIEMPAGTARWAAGLEYRMEEVSFKGLDVPQLGGGIFEATADRDVTSLFVEALVPLSDELELTVAGRHDDYSDWGDDLSPKLSMRWRPAERIVLRASAGRGFRVPNLELSNFISSSRVAFIDDEPSCEPLGQDADCIVIFQVHQTVSPALTSENSRQYSAGIVWEPADWLDLTLDYYDIELKDEIGFFRAYDLYLMGLEGLPQPPGLGVERAPDGLLLSITAGYGNLGRVETAGLDLNALFEVPAGPGRLTSNLQLSYVLDYRYEVMGTMSGDLVGWPGRPELRATLSNRYQFGNTDLVWNVRYIADQWGSAGSELEPEFLDGHVPSWVSHDLQARYRFDWNGELTVGVQNITDKQPPIGVGDSGNAYYDTQLYDGWGRIAYAQYTHRFE